MPSISILVPTHNRSEILVRTLECVANLDVPEGAEPELIVIANNCTDDTVSICEASIARLPFPGKVVEEPTPGLNPARNRAVREARGELCLLLDDDVAFEPTWLAEVHAFFKEQPADLAGGQTRLWWEAVDRPDWFTPRLDQLLSMAELGDAPKELAGFVGVVGANFWFRRKVWEAIGEFRNDLDRSGTAKLGGGESEFIQRAVQHGYRVFYSPGGAVQHWVAPGRIEPGYLLSVAEGTARGRMRFKPPMSPFKAARSLVGYTYLWLGAQLRAALTTLTRGRDHAMHHRVLSSAGWGGLLGLADRWFGGAKNNG